MVSVEDFPMSSSDIIPGYRIVETKGFVWGLTVRSRGATGQVGAGIKTLIGGEVTQFVKILEEAREEALERAMEKANELGANAMVAVRFDSNEISQIMQEVVIYGTAVVVEKEE